MTISHVAIIILRISANKKVEIWRYKQLRYNLFTCVNRNLADLNMPPYDGRSHRLVEKKTIAKK